MANHKSAIKRVRSNNAKKARNRYLKVTTLNIVKQIRKTTDTKEIKTLLPQVISKLDKLAKKNIIHKNKASNLKSKLARLAIAK